MVAKLDSEGVVAFALSILDETFLTGGRYYLDKGDSVVETLKTVSADAASRPVSARCATLSAQVEHLRFSLDVSNDVLLGKALGKLDWTEIWRTVNVVTPEEWDAIQARLAASYDAMRETIAHPERWVGHEDMREPLVVLAHSAYHLGEIRQALCTLLAE